MAAACGSGSVGLVIAESFRERTYIGLFKREAGLCFEGCVQMRVLAGVMEVEGHVIKPSKTFHSLYSPMTNSRMMLTCLLPELNDPDLRVHLQLLRVWPPHFTPLEQQGVGGIQLDLGKVDIENLNKLVHDKVWSGQLCAVVLFREVKGNLVDALWRHSLSDIVFPKRQTSLLKMFFIKGGLSMSLNIPATYRQLAWDIMAMSNSIVLVCGKKNTGKSTLCRILVNYLLNRHTHICYLECDVGQSEFTVPGVVALHSLSEPVHGPSYVHLRRPEKAFFFGDNSPKLNPDLYISLIKQCMSYYHAHFTGTPLIVNTCGYTSGLGVPLFHDVVRSVKPSHIIQLDLGSSCRSNVAELPSLTPAYLSSAEGWSLQPDQAPKPQQLVSDIGLFSSVDTKVLYASRKKVTTPGSPITISSDSEEELCVVDSDDEELTKDDDPSEIKGAGSEKPSHSSKKARTDDESKQENGEGQRGVASEREWSAGLQCGVCVVKVWKTGRVCTHGRFFRFLSYVAYFSPLLSTLSSLSSEMKQNFFMAAKPYEVPWSAVALHSIHRKVPYSQLLYAINGKFVALGKVSEDEIVDYGNRFPGITKFVKSWLPTVEFLGLGLVRGIDPTKKTLYVTTPEGHTVLSNTNCLVLGNTEHPHDVVSQSHIATPSPYVMQHFKHKSCGRLGWKES